MIVIRSKGLTVLLIAAISATVLFLSAGACLAQRDRRGANRPIPTPANSGDTAGTLQNQRQRGLEEALGPWLGIKIKETSPRFKTKGVLTEQVAPRSPADQAGLGAGEGVRPPDSPGVRSEGSRSGKLQATRWYVGDLSGTGSFPPT